MVLTKVNYIGVFRCGARLNPEKYGTNPTGMFESYYEMFTGDMPSSWEEKLNPAPAQIGMKTGCRKITRFPVY